MEKLRDHQLSGDNTFGIPARCDLFCRIDSSAEAEGFFGSGEAVGPLLIIGGGSNILFAGDFHGTVVRSAIKGFEIRPGAGGEHALVRCGSGEEWDSVVERALDAGLYGAENLSLIPGDVGASAVQNIGAYGAEASQIVHSVEAVDTATGLSVEIPARECRYSYRHSRFKDDWRGRYFITHVTYRLSRTFSPRTEYGNIRARLAGMGVGNPTPVQLRSAIIGIRREKLPDPAETGNAGSFFMNPVMTRGRYEALEAAHPGMPHYDMGGGMVKVPAGWLIEQCGWKGRAMGRAGVYSKQALVLVNLGGATGAEVVALCRAVARSVEEKFGIAIRPEVNIIG